MNKKTKRDLEKNYPISDFVAKLRRLARCVETKKRFVIHVAGERIGVPSKAVFNIEHERSGNEEELEFQIKWRRE